MEDTIGRHGNGQQWCNNWGGTNSTSCEASCNRRELNSNGQVVWTTMGNIFISVAWRVSKWKFLVFNWHDVYFKINKATNGYFIEVVCYNGHMSDSIIDETSKIVIKPKWGVRKL